MDNYCKHVGTWSTARRNLIAFGAFVCKHGIAFTSYLRYGFCLSFVEIWDVLSDTGAKSSRAASKLDMHQKSKQYSVFLCYLLLGVVSYVGVRVSSKMGKHGNRIEIVLCALRERYLVPTVWNRTRLGFGKMGLVGSILVMCIIRMSTGWLAGGCLRSEQKSGEFYTLHITFPCDSREVCMSRIAYCGGLKVFRSSTGMKCSSRALVGFVTCQSLRVEFDVRLKRNEMTGRLGGRHLYFCDVARA